MPKYFHATYGPELTELARPLVVIHLAADAGGVAGGRLSSSLIKRGHGVNFARKTTLLARGRCVLPVVVASQVHGLRATVAIISLAAAAHPGWSANLSTLVSDTFPRGRWGR